MDLYKIAFKSPDGRQQAAFAEGPEAHTVSAIFGKVTDGLAVEAVTLVDPDAWFTTDREGLMVRGEDGEDVEYEEPFVVDDDSGLAFFGSDSAQALVVQAGVDAGYGHIADQIAATRLDKDDLARIADALQLAWDNANAGSHKNRDRAVRSVLKGMAGAYSDTLAKVEALLER